MKATELVKELQYIINANGDCDVLISVEKQPDVKLPDQKYIIAHSRFVVVEKSDGAKPITVIRDWPY